MNKTTEVLDTLPRKKIEKFCEDWGIRRLAFFGSILTDSFNEESDIDVLVDFFSGVRKWPYENMVAGEMERILGRRVDMTFFEDVSKFTSQSKRENILDTAVEYYDAEK